MAGSAETQIRPLTVLENGFAKLVRICLGDAHPLPARSSERRKRPARLMYDVDEHPPLGIAFVLAVQHILVLSVGWIYIVVLVTALHRIPRLALLYEAAD